MSSKPISNKSGDKNPQTDADLFSQLQNGQTEVLGILYDRHSGLVHSIALKLLGKTTEAEDLTQDIFLSLMGQCSYDAQRGALRTYLCLLTRSRALDHLRKRTRQARKLHSQVLNENDKVLSNTLTEDLAQQKRSYLIQSALEQLSPKEREVLKMAYYKGLSQSEIANDLNISLGTVKSRSRRGLIKLRQALRDLRGDA